MENKPQKTLADYLMVAIGPVLIMLLLGSLVFFLIQVFYRGELVHGIRWVMFWFVLAIVLVSRVGIEQGKGHGRFYGAALAVTMWFYLAHTHNVPVLGAILLALTWWCAHVLTVDCTLISEEEDSGEGVLQGMWRNLEKSLVPPDPVIKPPTLKPLEILVAENLAKRRLQKQVRPPGRSVVYFSLAALPLFGLGQLFLPADDPHARRIGFTFLVIYLGAALSLLVATSFLGLRRYLRHRSVEMPASIAVGWIRFGAVLVGGVLLLAMILPRPGANHTWKDLAYRKEHKENKASEIALPFNPPGEGEGAPADQPVERKSPGVDSKKSSLGSATQNARNDRPNPNSQSDQPSQSDGGGGKGGNQGLSGHEGQSGENTQSSDDSRAQPKQTLRLKDVTPSGGADQSSDKDKPAAPGESGEPKGDGPGGQVAATDQPQQPNPTAKDSPSKPAKEQKPSVTQDKPVMQPEREQPENTTSVPKPPSHFLHRLLRVLLILGLAALITWALIRYRKAIAQMIRSIIAAARDFFRKLLSFRRRKPAPAVQAPAPAPQLHPFATYENPFLTGKDKLWPPERLLFYTYEVLQAWAKEQGIAIKAQQTPREFCFELIERFPEFGTELEQFSFYYAHAAFAKRLPEDFETDSIRRLWQYLGDSVMAVTAH